MSGFCGALEILGYDGTGSKKMETESKKTPDEGE